MSKITEALVIEAKAGILNQQTGDEQALTKLVTTDRRIVTVWHADNRLPAKVNEEVCLIEEASAKLNPETNQPYINYAIIPAAFAAKMKSK